MANFALIGASGYIAPRHMQAIKDTENNLIAAMDPNDSVGVMDSYFPDAHFITEFERFEALLGSLRSNGNPVDFISICSPNYLHDSHMRFALGAGADAICEKPLVLEPQQLDALSELERVTNKKIHTILQLRVHPDIKALRDRVNNSSKDKKHEVDLTYVTSRGKWYLESWKGDNRRSGGIATNIGVHFFDMLHFLFGKLQNNYVHMKEATKSAGYLEYEHARCRWFLSIDASDLPADIYRCGKRTYRSITVDGEEIEFSGGFSDLHTQVYKEILAGNGYGVEANRSAIEAVSAIHHAPVMKKSEMHPFLDRWG